MMVDGGNREPDLERVEDADFRPTPLIRLGRLAPDRFLWAKAEFLHPSGSAFDRVARPILEGVEDARAIVAGGGSHCLAFCRAAAVLGRELTVVCPESTLPEHLTLLAHHAARLVTSRAELGLRGAHDRAEEIAKAEGGVVAFSVRVHQRATQLFAESLGEEIVYAFERLDPKPEIVAAPVAAGALLGGVGRALAKAGHRAELVGTVRPESRSVQDGTLARDEVMEEGIVRAAVSDRDAYEVRMSLARKEGMLVGMGSAAALFAVLERKQPAIAIMVDAGDRYFSVDRRLAG
jgi:cysteine synthase